MYLPPANKIMYSITYKKRKPPDLLKFLMLKICPNVTDFYPKMVPLKVNEKMSYNSGLLLLL